MFVSALVIATITSLLVGSALVFQERKSRKRTCQSIHRRGNIKKKETHMHLSQDQINQLVALVESFLPPPGGFSQADIDAAVASAVAALKLSLKSSIDSLLA